MGTVHPLLLPLLRALHAERLYPDSKTIVDGVLLSSPEEVAAVFAQLQLPSRPGARREALLQFVDRWVGPVESDLDLDHASPDAPPPGWLPLVQDAAARRWAHHLLRTWSALTRAVVPGVRQHPERHSLLWLPHPFVAPGARFREAYYWDSLWVVQGLLVSSLARLATDVVSNLLFLVDTYGFVPNGSRAYYLNRSQPPLLSEMVRAVHAATGDRALLTRALPALVREHGHWAAAPKGVRVEGRDGLQYHMSRYYAEWDQPRPESYREDVETVAAAGLEGDTDASRELYRNIASAAESGWDFSSRWLRDSTALHSARTTSVLPADLNAFLYQAERNISAIAGELGEARLAARFERLAEQRLQGIAALHWDPATGQWRDLVLSGTTGEGPCAGSITPGGVYRAGQRNPGVFASNWVPLWCGCAAAGSDQAAAAVASLQASGLIQPGGVAASLVHNGQQWDGPNAWPPLQGMLVEGCQRYGGDAGARLARELAHRYLHTAYVAWSATGRMFEKFDCTVVGAPGKGGEYEVVDGFGWSNGVALQFLDEYGWS